MAEEALLMRREYQKRYREKHKEEISEYKKKYAKNNRNKINAYAREWSKGNKEKIRQYNARYWQKKYDENSREESDKSDT